MLQRAKAEGVAAMLCWFADMERLDELTSFCQANSGFAYFIAGDMHSHIMLIHVIYPSAYCVSIWYAYLSLLLSYV